MTQEQLRMQMLAGIITEGQYKAKLNENQAISFTSDQEEIYQNALIKKFNEDKESDGEEEAVHNLSHNNELIIANILSDLEPLTDDWYAEIGDWDRGDEDDENHPTYILKSKRYDFEEIENFMKTMLKKFEEKSTNNPEIKEIQEIIQSYSQI